MADANEKVEANETAAAKRAVPVMPLMISVVAAVVIAVGAVGGAGFWLVHSGRLPVVQGATKTVVLEKVKATTKLVPLEPLLVNLADEGGRSYLRVAITFRVEDTPAAGARHREEKAEKGTPVNENEAAMRDAALTVLGKQTGAALLEPDGKETLKADLKKQMKDSVPELKVVDVLFTEFLVQR